MAQSVLQYDYCRKFGVEIELNSFNGRTDWGRGKLPDGIYHVANLICRQTKEYTEIRKWANTHWQDEEGHWVVKPDGSCGIEVCSPVLKGGYGLKKIGDIINLFALDKKIKTDERCSFHVHVDISDCDLLELERILVLWIKCEHIFASMFPDSRKNNKYCQFIGLWDWLEHDTILTPKELIELLSCSKYLSLNTFHLYKGNRATIEFRLGHHCFCKNAYLAESWIKLLIHFVEMAKNINLKKDYVKNDRWSSFLWLDLNDVLDILEFNGCLLSEEMSNLRRWFIARIIDNHVSSLPGIYSEVAQKKLTEDVNREYFKINASDLIKKIAVEER